MRTLLRLVRLARLGRARLVLSVVLGAATLACAVGLFATSGFLIARAAQHPSITALTVAVVAVRALAIGRAGFRYAERLGTHDVALRVLADVRSWFYRRLERVLPQESAQLRSGDLLARLVSDVDAVQDLFVRGLVPVLTAAIVAVGVVAAFVVVLPGLGIALAAGLIAAGVLLPVLVLRLTAARARRSAAARGRITAEITGVFEGAAELAAFGATTDALAAVESTDDDLARLGRRDAATSGTGLGLGTLVSGLTLWLVLLIGVTALHSHRLGPVALAVVTFAAMAAFEITQPLPAAAVALSAARASGARVFAVTDAPDTVVEPALPHVPPTGPYTLHLRDVWARYPAAAGWALSGVDLDLGPGRRIALVGPNGAGKSSLIAVLLRLLDVSSGVALLDGVPLSAYAAEDVRRVISGVTQDPHIFAASLRDNLRIGRPDADDDELADAADRARLSAWIEQLPGGLSTPLGSGGVRVSGGERQRIALARALLAAPRVLVLDEPTAHVDEETRSSLIADLLALTIGRTTVLATHDVEALHQVDEIVVLDAGRVAQRGTHDELLGEPGPYRALWRARVPR